MFKIIFFETGLIPIEKKQKLLSLAQVSRILILTVFACSKTHKEVFRPRFEGKRKPRKASNAVLAMPCFGQGNSQELKFVLQTFPFAETLTGIEPGGLSRQKHRHRIPTV